MKTGLPCRREHLRHSDLPGCVELSAEFISAMLFGTGVGVTQEVKQEKPKSVVTPKPVKAGTTKWKTTRAKK